MTTANRTFLVLASMIGLAILGVALLPVLPEWVVGGALLSVAAIVVGVYVYAQSQ